MKITQNTYIIGAAVIAAGALGWHFLKNKGPAAKFARAYDVQDLHHAGVPIGVPPTFANIDNRVFTTGPPGQQNPNIVARRAHCMQCRAQGCGCRANPPHPGQMVPGVNAPVGSQLPLPIP